MSGSKQAVYRALIGGYEQLREEPIARESNIPFICLTDDPTLRSQTWTIVVTKPRFPQDLSRSARFLKIMGHPCLAEFDESLWVDNTVELRSPPEEILDTWLKGVDIATPLHSYRQSIFAEAEAVVDAGLEGHERTYEQLSHYLRTHPTVLDQNPHWTGMLARRHTPEVVAAMRVWWEHVLRYTRRDQISFMPAMSSRGVEIKSIHVDTMRSAVHEWPRAEGRVAHQHGSALRETLRPAAGRIGVLEQALDDAAHALAVTVAQREEVIASLEDDRDVMSAEVERLRESLASAEGTEQELRVALARRTKRARRLRRRLQRANGGEPNAATRRSRRNKRR